MERDFMGLKTKESLVVVKEEMAENPQDSGAQWEFMNRMSSIPHFLSFKTGQNDRAKKTEAFDQNHKPVAAEAQRVSDINMSVSNQSPSVSNIILQPAFASCGQNLVGASMRQQYPSVPVTAPSNGPIVGSTESGINLKPCAGPAQMTIFYAGNVGVYDDLSPEKAQAIMLLAGNSSSFAGLAHTRPTVQTSAAKVVTNDSTFVNQPLNLQPAPGLSSPLSVSANSTLQLGSGSKNANNLPAVKSTEVPTTPASKPELRRVVSSVGPRPIAAMLPAALPQARKASLARFLEKRKERVMNAAPYSCDKKNPEEAAIKNDASQSAGSAVNSGSQA